MRHVASSTVLRLLFPPAHLQLGLYLSALGNTPPPACSIPRSLYLSVCPIVTTSACLAMNKTVSHV